MKRNKTCATCSFWNQSDDSEGECRRYAPQAQRATDGDEITMEVGGKKHHRLLAHKRWLATMHSDWCGDWVGCW